MNKNLMLMTGFAAVAGYWFARLKAAGRPVAEAIEQPKNPDESIYKILSLPETEYRSKKDWENAGTFKPNLWKKIPTNL